MEEMIYDTIIVLHLYKLWMSPQSATSEGSW